ncbi:MAG: hypothetical protein ACE5GO_05285, partial [Anaerolineales bacterium]
DALAAGSTAHLTLATPVDLKTLNQFVLDGIGLRREEGFGQIAINHPIYPAYQPDQAVPVSIKMSNKTGMHLKRHRLPSWKQNWHNILDKADWQTCRNPRFTAIARWLHTNQGRPPEALAAEIETLGAPTEKFIKWFGRQEYGARAKENKLKKGNQEPIEGIDLIKKMLIKLNRYNQPFHPAGLEMLADRVAGAVDRDEN